MDLSTALEVTYLPVTILSCLVRGCCYSGITSLIPRHARGCLGLPRCDCRCIRSLMCSYWCCCLVDMSCLGLSSVLGIRTLLGLAAVETNSRKLKITWGTNQNATKPSSLGAKPISISTSCMLLHAYIWVRLECLTR